jgi:NAD(P)H-quinone oxidoreductase subunit 4
VAELMVFVGFATSDAYSFTFRLITVIFMAIGVILTPIYLLSMLREIFYGPENKELIENEVLADAEPREVFVIACLLVPIIGFGFYPKMLTQIYDATTQKLTARLGQVFVASEAVTEGSAPLAALPVLKAPSLSQ